MTPETGDARRLRIVTRAILAVGFAAAAVVWAVNGAVPADPLGRDPLETKKYLHDLEVYSGKANILAAEFREWFAGLWYGRHLAYTIAAITVLLVAAIRLGFSMREEPVDVEPEDGSWGGHAA